MNITMPRATAAGAVLAAILTVIPAATQAQADSARPQFDVASVKPNRSGEPGLRLDVQADRMIATNIPLKQLIRAAYTLQLYQIVDAPSWVDTDRFDIIARANHDLTVTAPWTPGGSFALVQLMAQSLLADRFRMVAHMEERESPGYVLVVANPQRGHKLVPAAPDCAASCGMRLGPGTLTARKVPIRQVAELLSQVTGRLVIDETGVNEPLDLDLHWSPDSPQAATDAPSVFTAVQEQLGLRLEPRRLPQRVLVIESIQPPTPD
jgi:uncharacterized protein (TIGR03435 family)